MALFAYRKAIHSEFIYDDNVRIMEVNVNDVRMAFAPLPSFSQGLGTVLREVLPDRPLLMAMHRRYVFLANTLWRATLNANAPTRHRAASQGLRCVENPEKGA